MSAELGGDVLRVISSRFVGRGSIFTLAQLVDRRLVVFVHSGAGRLWNTYPV